MGSGPVVDLVWYEIWRKAKKKNRAQSQLWIWFAIWFYMNLITKKDSSLKVRLLLTPSSPRSFSNTETKQQMIRPYFLWPKLRFLTDTGGLTEGWIEQQTNYQTTLVSSLLLFNTLTQYTPIICLLLRFFLFLNLFCLCSIVFDFLWVDFQKISEVWQDFFLSLNLGPTASFYLKGCRNGGWKKANLKIDIVRFFLFLNLFCLCSIDFDF